mmetsp:Transcript_4672/g.29486  ORF Transcript_4672/g.29486 Transcript_4672/m.29486 type:complete len:296 (-) Transcript_4672:2763-3650(-)
MHDPLGGPLFAYLASLPLSFGVLHQQRIFHWILSIARMHQSHVFDMQQVFTCSMVHVHVPHSLSDTQSEVFEPGIRHVLDLKIRVPFGRVSTNGFAVIQSIVVVDVRVEGAFHVQERRTVGLHTAYRSKLFGWTRDFLAQLTQRLASQHQKCLHPSSSFALFFRLTHHHAQHNFIRRARARRRRLWRGSGAFLELFLRAVSHTCTLDRRRLLASYLHRSAAPVCANGAFRNHFDVRRGTAPFRLVFVQRFPQQLPLQDGTLLARVHVHPFGHESIRKQATARCDACFGRHADATT